MTWHTFGWKFKTLKSKKINAIRTSSHHMQRRSEITGLQSKHKFNLHFVQDKIS